MGYTHGTPRDAEFKTCTSCGKTYPNTREYFYWSTRNQNTFAKCKRCSSERNKNRNIKMKKRFDNVDGHIIYDNEKECIKCGRILPNSYYYFPEDKTVVSGLRNVCRECDYTCGRFLPEGYEPPKDWSNEEDEIIIKYYKDYTGKEIQAQFLPNRTVRAIECRGSFLGVQGKNDEVIKRGREIATAASVKVTKGRTLSDDQKQLLSERLKEYYQTHTPYWLGRKRSEKEKKMISERMKGKWAGDKNPRHINPLFGSMNGRWKGGVNQTYHELRSDTRDWQLESMEFCDYKCIITGKGFDNVHHTVPFRDIVREVFNNTHIELKEQVLDYQEEEFQQLRDELKYLHTVYGFGACLNQSVHKLFHNIYGYFNFTPYDFLDFIYDIDCGEYDKWFEDNDLCIDINYEYVDYLENILLYAKCA